MKIAISLLNFRPGTIGGAETYIRSVLSHLNGLRNRDEITLVEFRGNVGSVEAAGLSRTVVNRSDGRIVLDRCVEAFTPLRAKGIERCFDEIAPDVAFFPQQSIFPKKISCPCVMTVVDVQHLFFPRYFGLFARTFRKTAYLAGLKRADHIISISEYTKETLVERCGISRERITAIPFGLSEIKTENAEPFSGVEGKYLYYPAATFPHKNHDVLFKTFAELKKRGGFDYKLVLTGMRTKRWKMLQKLAAGLGIGGDVLHLGFVPFERLAGIYLKAEAVVFPTGFEGFGLPAIEAVQYGKKVICSRLKVFDEIGVPPQNQINFSCPDELSAALAKEGPTTLTKPPRTWRQTAQETLDVLRKIAKR